MQQLGAPGGVRPPGTVIMPAGVGLAQGLQMAPGVLPNPQLQAMQQAAMMRANPALAQQFQMQLAAQQRLAAAGGAQPGALNAVPSAGALASAGAAMRPPAVHKPAAAAPATAGARADSASGASAAAAAAAKRMPGTSAVIGRKRKVLDLPRPDRGEAALVLDSPLFAELQEQERQADLLVARKRNELREMFASFRRGPPGTPEAAGAVRRKLRVYIYHKYSPGSPAAAAPEPSTGQAAGAQAAADGTAAAGAVLANGAPAAAAAQQPPEPPSWQLVLSGRLIVPRKEGEGKEAATGIEELQRQPFTYYLRFMEVELCNPDLPEHQRKKTWRKEAHAGEHRDSIEVRGTGATPFTAKITLQLDYSPDQWALDSKLASALGVRPMHSLPFIVQALFAWVKSRGLFKQSKEEQGVRCSDELRDVFGLLPQTERLSWEELQAALRKLLRPPEPIRLEYHVRMDGRSPAHPQCYDLDYEVPLNSDMPAYAAPQSSSAEREAAAADMQLGSVLARLQEHRRRRDFYLAFAQDPCGFVQALVAAQGREMRIASTREGEVLEVVAAGDVWKEKWAEEAVMQYLQRPKGSSLGSSKPAG